VLITTRPFSRDGFFYFLAVLMAIFDFVTMLIETPESANQQASLTQPIF
jgi:hypothetical protein